MQALTPFLAVACVRFAGDLFDASKFSEAVEELYGLKIPRLAALGLAEQLEKEGVLEAQSGYSSSTMVYRYAKVPYKEDQLEAPVTESEINGVLDRFVQICREDEATKGKDRADLELAFLDRLLNIDSMRLLGRRDQSIATKKSGSTLLLKTTKDVEVDLTEVHLDFLVSRFLLDLRDSDGPAFERVSDIAFANMAAEALACFREPESDNAKSLPLVVYLDSPILLDILGVNREYSEYGLELLNAIKDSGAEPVVLDHCIAEAESVVAARLAAARSGINKFASQWGTSTNVDVLSALVGRVGDAAKRQGIVSHRVPENTLYRKSPPTVGDIEADMNRRMQAWKNEEAKEYDRNSVWCMLTFRDTSKVCTRVCDSRRILISRNTSLVVTANRAWGAWLGGTTKFSRIEVEGFSPIAMSDKQFAGYLWGRTGGGRMDMSKARLLAHCSSAVRPRADVKARAYNLVLEFDGQQEADHVAALMEDREGARALMRATHGDPEDVTPERIPFILEQVKLAAGAFAAEAVRSECRCSLMRCR